MTLVKLSLYITYKHNNIGSIQENFHLAEKKR